MDNAGDETRRRTRAARFATMPIVLAGTIAVTAGLTGPVAHAAPRNDDSAHRRHADTDDSDGDGRVFATALSTGAPTVTTVAAVTSAAPTEYTVVQGDTVSSIAARFGLSAQEILVRNGLGWNTLIQPGQKLRLATTPVAAAASTSSDTSYRVREGDTISGIAAKEGVSANSLLAANSLSGSSVIYPDQTLKVPSASAATTASATAASAQRTAAASSSSSSSVTVAAGQTIATIAAAHGVSVSALLAANGLTYTSTIYAGSTLVIPSTDGLTAEQRQNAETIVSVGRSLGVPSQGIVIALAAAMQESGLRNLDYGDSDSVGVFQQRPSQGWGAASQLMDVSYAARLFYGGPHNPNAGKTRGLLDIPGWTSMSVTQAAQAVQRSAYPKAYSQWQQQAEGWLASL